MSQQKHLNEVQKDAIAYSIDNVSKAFKIDPFWVFAVIYGESRFVIKAKSDKKCQGLMQLYKGSALRLLAKLNLPSKTQWREIEYNILLGSFFLSLLLHEFHSEMMAIMGYNAGPEKLKGYIKDRHIPKSVAEFANSILRYRILMQQEYDRWLPSTEICRAEMCW